MKKATLLLFLIYLAFCNTAFGQDKILLRSGDEMMVKVLEISPDSIKFTNLADSNPGKLQALPKSSVFFVTYQNGTKEVMPEQTNPALPKLSERNLYELGRTEGRKNYKAGGVFWATFATSLAVPIGGPLLGIPTGVVLTAVNVSDKNIIASNPEYKQSPSYLKGYQKEAKMKKGNNALAGVGAGTALLVGAVLVALNSY